MTIIYSNQQIWIPELVKTRYSTRKGYRFLPSSRMYFLSGSRKALQDYIIRI